MEAIATVDHLKSFLTSLNTEVCRVWEHWTVLRGVHKAYDDYWLEMNESDHFWRIISRALQDVIIVRLAALVDPKNDVVSVPNFLRILQAQTDPTKSILAITPEKLEEIHLGEDLAAVNKDQALIHTVRKLRNKLVAHRDMEMVVKNDLRSLPALPDADLEALIEMLYQMIHKYCPVVGVNPIVLGFSGDHDYKALFKLLRAGFEANGYRNE